MIQTRRGGFARFTAPTVLSKGSVRHDTGRSRWTLKGIVTNPRRMNCPSVVRAALGALSAIVALAAAPMYAAPAASRPNIVFIITDDQGYGDFGHTGNPLIKTPHVDRLAAESSNLTDYHVSPTCSPTRASLLTGRWANRTGVWHTIAGRSMLRDNEVTLAQVLKDHGYATGMFGKWHLGDTFPSRPEDRGFTEVYRHGGGGVGQTPDVWDNAYFDGAYFHNGRIVAAEGFCTDVFFEQAGRFIRDSARKRQPFFAYISTNAPHGPFHAPQRYLDMYPDQPTDVAAFLGMITNIDDNVGKTRALLREIGIADNTVFIYTTDNGTALGDRIFNAGMRGRKGSEYDGGHRVPFILHWPAAGMNRHYANPTLAHAVDVMPTLLEIAGARPPRGVKLDGISIRPLFDPKLRATLPERFVISDSQRVANPVKWKQSAVMSGTWRLINGRELYDMQRDPGQQNDIAAQHPAQVAKMRAFYESWWSELEPTFAQTVETHLGHRNHPQVTLTAHDWLDDPMPPWNHMAIRRGESTPPQRAKQKSTEPRRHTGYWAVKVLAAGNYTISLRRWPAEADKPISAGLPAGANVPGGTRAYRAHEGVALPIAKAVLRIDGKDVQTRPVTASDTQVSFTAKLGAGSHRLAPYFVTENGEEIGAFFVTVSRAR
jgi:arylsulfatase A-like enzyme